MAQRRRWHGVAAAGMMLGVAMTLQPGTSVGGTASKVAAAPVKTSDVLSFDRLPGAEWYRGSCSEEGSTTVDHGFLTVDSPDGDCRLFLLDAPNGVWTQQSRNARGWVVEAALRLDPSTTETCSSDEGNEGVELWLYDDKQLLTVGVAANGVCLSYPDYELAPVPTTDGVHVYRVEARGRIVRVYRDGRLVIDHVLSRMGGGAPQTLGFGDFNGSGGTLSQWDYLRYQTRPGFKASDWVGSAWPAGTRKAPAVRLRDLTDGVVS